MSIGSRITEWRKARGLTQAKLADRAQISASAIAMYETNRRSPDDAALTKLAEALGIPSVLLTGGANSDEKATEADPVVVAAGSTPSAASGNGTDRATPITSAKPKAPAPGKAATESTAGSTVVSGETTKPSTTAEVGGKPSGTTQLALTHEEAKIILFLRMNPSSMAFFESYIRSDSKQRDQLNRTWRLIHDFQKAP